MNEVFVNAPKSDLSLRNSCHKLKQPFGKTSASQGALSFFGPALWNKITEEIKRTTSVKRFNHNFNKQYLNEIEKSSFWEKIITTIVSIIDSIIPLILLIYLIIVIITINTNVTAAIINHVTFILNTWPLESNIINFFAMLFPTLHFLKFSFEGTAMKVRHFCLFCVCLFSC